MGVKNKVTSSVILSVFSVTQCGFLEASATSKTKTSENLVNDLSKKVKSGDASKGNGKKVSKKKNVKKGEENLKAKNNVSIEQVTKSTGTESKKDEKKADDVLIKAEKIQKAGADSNTTGKKSKNKLRKESKKPEKEAKVKTEETKTEVGSKKDKEEKTLNIEKNAESNAIAEGKEDKKEKMSASSDKTKTNENKLDTSSTGKKEKKKLRNTVKKPDVNQKKENNKVEAKKDDKAANASDKSNLTKTGNNSKKDKEEKNPDNEKNAESNAIAEGKEDKKEKMSASSDKTKTNENKLDTSSTGKKEKKKLRNTVKKPDVNQKKENNKVEAKKDDKAANASDKSNLTKTGNNSKKDKEEKNPDNEKNAESNAITEGKEDKKEKMSASSDETTTNTNDSKVLKTEDKSEDIEDSIKEVKEENNKVDGSQIGNDLNGEAKGKSKEEIFESKENQNKHGKNGLIDDFDKVFDGSYDDFSSGKSSKSNNNFFKNFDVGDTVIASSLALAGTSVADRKLNNGRLSSFVGNLLFSRKDSSNIGTKHQEEESIVPKENVPEKKESKKVVNKPLDYPLKFSFMPYQIASAISNKEVSVPLFDSNGPIVGFLNNWANVAFKGSFDKGYGELFGDWLSYISDPRINILLYGSIVRKVLWPILTCSPDIFSFFKNELFGSEFVGVMFAYLVFPVIVYFLIGHKLIHQKLGFEPLVALQRLIDREGKWYEVAGLAVRDIVRSVVGPIWYIFAGIGNAGKRLYYEGSLFPDTSRGILGTLSFTGKIFLPAVYYISEVTNLFKGDSDAIKLLSYVNKEGKASDWVVDKGIFSLKDSFKAIKLNEKLKFFDKNGEVNIDEIFEYAKGQIVLKADPGKKADEKFLEFINLPWWEFGDWIGAMPKRLRYIHDEVLEKLIEFAKKGENNEVREAVDNYLENTKLYGKNLKELFREDLDSSKKKLLKIQKILENIKTKDDKIALRAETLELLNEKDGIIYQVLKNQANISFVKKLLGSFKIPKFTPKPKEAKPDWNKVRRFFAWIYYHTLDRIEIKDRKGFIENNFGGYGDVKSALKDGRKALLKELGDKKIVELFVDLNTVPEGENEIDRKVRESAYRGVFSFVIDNNKISDFVKNKKVKDIIDSKYEGIKNNKGKMADDVELVANLKNNLALKKLIAVSEVLFDNWKIKEQANLAGDINSSDVSLKNRMKLLSAWFKNYGTGKVTADEGIDDVKKVSKVVVGLWADKNKLIEEINKEDKDFYVNNFTFNQENMSVEAMIQKLGAKDLVPGVELSAKAAAQLIAEIDKTENNDYQNANDPNTKELKSKVDALCRALGKNVPDFVDGNGANNRQNAKNYLEDILNNFIKSADYKGDDVISELEDLLKVNNEKNPSAAELSAAGLIISKLATEGKNENKGKKFKDLLFTQGREVNKRFLNLLVKYYNLREEYITKDGGCKNIADILVLLMCSSYENEHGLLNVNSLKYKILKNNVIGQDCSNDINGNEVLNVLKDLLTKVDNEAKGKLGNDDGAMYKELVRLMQLLVPAGEVDKKLYFRNNFASRINKSHIAPGFEANGNNLKLLEDNSIGVMF